MPPAYRPYWNAWLVLLAVTLAMVVVGSPVLLLAGIAVKASIIALWFMHLRHEAWPLIAAVAIGILATAGVLFGLIVPDGFAM